jgi:predicted nucleic acid-binding protein
MSVVVSDTSPIRALAHLGHVEWLPEFFGEVSFHHESLTSYPIRQRGSPQSTLRSGRS